MADNPAGEVTLSPQLYDACGAAIARSAGVHHKAVAIHKAIGPVGMAVQDNIRAALAAICQELAQEYLNAVQVPVSHIHPVPQKAFHQSLRVIHRNPAAVTVSGHLKETNVRVFPGQRLAVAHHITQVKHHIRPDGLHTPAHEFQHAMGIGQNQNFQ